MKFLVLNSKLDFQNALFQSFIEKGWGYILVHNAQELWDALELHGRSIDLGIFKYEDIPNGFLKKLKSNSEHEDLPFIITYETLSLEECAKHQKTEFGAHAYFAEPLQVEPFLSLLLEVLPEKQKAVEEKSEPSAVHVIQLEFEEENKDEEKSEDVPFLKEVRSQTKESMEVLKEDTFKDIEGEEKIKDEFPYLFDQFDHLKIAIQEDNEKEMNLIDEPSDGIDFDPGVLSDKGDINTLKTYLELREKDVLVLKKQNKTLREELQKSKESLKLERIRFNEVEFIVKDQQRKILELQNELAVMKRSHEAELEDLKIVQKDKNTKIKILEEMMSTQKDEQNKLKDRVRSDIRKIRMREKELENRLEILRKDSEALLGARESKILDLKRKLDLTEFNLDLMQEQNQKEKEKISKLKEKLQRASQAMRLAGGFLGDEHLNNEDEVNSKLLQRDVHKKIS